jgi:hypothetical protein
MSSQQGMTLLLLLLLTQAKDWAMAFDTNINTAAPKNTNLIGSQSDLNNEALRGKRADQNRRNLTSPVDIFSSVPRLVGNISNGVAYLAGDQKCVLQYPNKAQLLYFWQNSQFLKNRVQTIMIRNCCYKNKEQIGFDDNGQNSFERRVFDTFSGTSLGSPKVHYHDLSTARGNEGGMMIVTRVIKDIFYNGALHFMFHVDVTPYDESGVLLAPRQLTTEPMYNIGNATALDYLDQRDQTMSFKTRIFYIGNDRFLALWTNTTDLNDGQSPSEIWAQTVDPRGEKLGPLLRPDEYPLMIFRLNTTNLLSVNTQYQIAVTNNALVRQGPLVSLSPTLKDSSYRVFLVQLGNMDRFVMMHNDRLLQIFNSSGRVGEPVQLVEHPSYKMIYGPTTPIALDENHFVVVYGVGLSLPHLPEYNHLLDPASHFILGRIFDSSARPIGGHFRVSLPSAALPAGPSFVAKAGPGRFAVFWAMTRFAPSDYKTPIPQVAYNDSVQFRLYSAAVDGSGAAAGDVDGGPVQLDSCPSAEAPAEATAAVAVTSSAGTATPTPPSGLAASGSAAAMATTSGATAAVGPTRTSRAARIAPPVASAAPGLALAALLLPALVSESRRATPLDADRGVRVG